MYKKYNLENVIIDESAPYVQKYKHLFDNQQNIVRSALDAYILKDGIIDGDKIREDWFPTDINAKIFISHSHYDQKLAVNLACWIYANFHIMSFIDSCVWGYANDLLLKLDARYCKKENGLYDYDKRNCSTSHVHIILTTALNKMIDRAECLFFLNTQNSIKFKGIEDKTLSPWIYSELETARTIRVNIPTRWQSKYCFFSYSGQLKEARETSDFKVAYAVDTSQLYNLKSETLQLWRKKTSISNLIEEKALDALYSITE